MITHESLMELSEKLSGQELQPYQREIFDIISRNASVAQLPMRECPPPFFNSPLKEETVKLFRSSGISVKNTRPILVIR